jgi:Uncharacterised nucleotidyltransferase/Protein of unknown function (DUF5672)
MSSPLTLENSLILACARTDPDGQRIEDLVRRGPDWHAILRRVERWGMVPLVSTNLRQAVHSSQVPIQVMERLRNLNHRDTIHGVARRELLRTALLRFSESGVPVIVLKGAALAALVYPFPALRPMRDIDLLVHRRDMERVEAVLHSLRDAPAAGSNASSGNPPLDPKRLALLDIRQDIFSAWIAADGLPSARRIPIADFWERARPAQIESVTTLVFSPEDLLLYLAFHLTVATGFVGQVRTLCDIGELCRCCGNTFEWSQLVSRAGCYDIQKPLYYALCLAREMVGAGVPSEVLRELRTSFRQLPLEERLIAAVARRAIVCDDQETPRPWKVYRLSMRLLVTRSARDGVTLAYHRLARPSQARLRRLGNKPRPRRGRFMRAQLPATAIVLPIYRRRLESEILAAVDRAFAILRHGDWYLIAPQSLDASFYEQRYGKPIVRFPDACLASVQNYSRLLLTDEFYAAFAQYEYMLVTQDDVYVLRDDLPYWLSRRLDYIGAPWPDGHDVPLSISSRPSPYGDTLRAYVGNGGFSLRRIAACRQLLAEFPEEVAWFSEKGWAEDMFFGVFGQFSQYFVLPNQRVAATFAWEMLLPRMHTLCEGQLPMAIHAYRAWDPEFFTDIILPAALSDMKSKNKTTPKVAS